MIKATELRLGNIVFSLFNNCKVIEIYETSILVQFITGKKEVYDLEKVELIPLTPEILKKCGFINEGMSVDANWHFKLISFPSNHRDVTYELNLFITDEKGKYGINLEEQYFGYCNSLHRLQNIYYCLTDGEELNIEL